MPLRRCGSVSERLMVWFSRRRAAGEGRGVGVEGLEAAGVERPHGRLAAHQVEGCALLRRGLREEERPGREVEGGEAHLRGHLGAGVPPPQAPRDHQVEHEVKVALEVEDDALAHAAHRLDALAVRLAERGIERAARGRAGHANRLERLADDAAAQVHQVDFDVGQLGHGRGRVARPARARVSRVRARTACPRNGPRKTCGPVARWYAGRRDGRGDLTARDDGPAGSRGGRRVRPRDARVVGPHDEPRAIATVGVARRCSGALGGDRRREVRDAAGPRWG